MFKQNKVYDFRQANKEYREVLEDKDEEVRKLKETVRQLKRQNLEAEISYYNTMIKLSELGHSNDMYKNIKMMKIIDETYKELFEDLKIELYADDDQDIKKELDTPGNCI